MMQLDRDVSGILEDPIFHVVVGNGLPEEMLSADTEREIGPRENLGTEEKSGYIRFPS